MKLFKPAARWFLAAALLAAPLAAFSADATKADKPKPWPATLTACVVSGEKLGSMGKPYVFVHEGQEIKMCCPSCLKEFKADPAKYLKKIAAAPPAEKK
ncbi:MAG: hypothetical protein HY301_12690 [Verrucomicrobia bacterium]|nr:hypothetical protein [Verrucomicrobiota bacterium]